MAWRSAEKTDKVLSQLEVIRTALEDPATGLSALYVTLDQSRQKVLESVAQGTLGLREENRELRRRQERMITDLADTRSSLEALSQRMEQNTKAPPEARAPDLPAPVVVADPVEQPAAIEDPHGAEASAAPSKAIEPVERNEARVDPLEEVRTAHGQARAAGEIAAPPESPAKSPREDTSAAGQEDDRAHLGRLLSAASIASAQLVCHRETWDFIAEQTSGRPHFRLPEQVDDVDDGRIQTSLSGRSLLALLTTMWQVIRDHETSAASGKDQDPATWALAAAVYRRTALAVDQVTHEAEKENGPAVIVLDDRSRRTAATS
ncbi:hypothetical protein ACIBBE_03140 [Streptomyces sp. NPDC051644]|uniref:hypothetical protein n=1 Tax=Streptomyces sp. NPDC051644 TaxID=3365666 RepID=UPI0037914282